LTIKTLPDLLEKINQWNLIRPVHHYQNSVNTPEQLCIDIFGDIFREDFNRAIKLQPEQTLEQIATKKYLIGIAQQSQHTGPNLFQIRQLFNFLNTMDQRRNTHWPTVFPWLVDEFKKYNL
jgi:hypothetical protein